MASSTDVIGPLTRTVEDAALVPGCYGWQDPLDSTTMNVKEDYPSRIHHSKAKAALLQVYCSRWLAAQRALK